MDGNFVNLPSELRSRHPSSRNWGTLCDKLEKILPDIALYIEPGLYTNHFTHKQSEKKVWEGMWQLHVMWALQQNGFTLEQPTNNDDIFLLSSGERMAVEATFTNANDPSTFHYGVYKNLSDARAADIDGTDEALIQQLLVVLEKKERDLTKRSPRIPRLVALNGVQLGNGFEYWDMTIAQKIEKLSQEIQNKSFTAINGVLYDFISYTEFFSNSKLSLIWHGGKLGTFAQVLELASS